MYPGYPHLALTRGRNPALPCSPSLGGRETHRDDPEGQEKPAPSPQGADLGGGRGISPRRRAGGSFRGGGAPKTAVGARAGVKAAPTSVTPAPASGGSTQLLTSPHGAARGRRPRSVVTTFLRPVTSGPVPPSARPPGPRRALSPVGERREGCGQVTSASSGGAAGDAGHSCSPAMGRKQPHGLARARGTQALPGGVLPGTSPHSGREHPLLGCTWPSLPQQGRGLEARGDGGRSCLSL